MKKRKELERLRDTGECQRDKSGAPCPLFPIADADCRLESIKARATAALAAMKPSKRELAECLHFWRDHYGCTISNYEIETTDALLKRMEDK